MKASSAWFCPAAIQPTSGSGPCPRAAHSCDLVGNKLFVFGGWDGKRALNDLHVLNFETSAWKQVELRGVAPTARNNHTIAMVGVCIYLHGGHDGTKWLNDMHVLDVESMIWSRPNFSGDRPKPRQYASSIRHGSKILVTGGCDFEKKSCFFQEFA